MLWNNPKIVSKTPIATLLLIESSSVTQLHRMWSESTAAGLSLQSWLLIVAARLLWWNFYRVITPEQWLARVGSTLGILLDLSVIVSVLWFRVSV